MNKGLSDNGRTAIGFACVTLIFIYYFLMLAWSNSPSEFTFKVEIDNNTKEAVESVEYPLVHGENTYINVIRVYNDSSKEIVGSAINSHAVEIYGDCEYRFAFGGNSE